MKGKTKDSWPKVKGFIGLHAKSYTWIVDFDSWARNFLSCVYNCPGLDEYYTSCLRHYHMYTDRYKETSKYLNFMVTTDETRINFMYLTKSFSRKTLVEMLSYLERLLDSKNEEDRNTLYDAWPVSPLFEVQVRETRAKVNGFLVLLYHFLKSLVIQLLISNRDKRKSYDADKLRTEAFSVLLTMLEKYQLHHSGFKVPFTTQLMWLSKPKKKEIVEYEMWGFGENSKVYSIDLTEIEGQDFSLTENRTLNLEAINKIQEQEEQTSEQEEMSASLEDALSIVPSAFRNFIKAITEERHALV